MVGDLNGNKDFSVIKPFAFWTQHVLPLVYGDEISYMETLDKVVKLLNELIKNNNKLPEYIQQIVEEYITGGPLEEVLRSILADFILNVKYPPAGITPAKGDGTANDYEAIQGCIDYAASKGGGVVYFPFGKYLTSKITLKPNVSLMGFGKYCTSIVLTGGETDALLSGTVNDCGIYNITLDANMSIQVNDVDVLTLTGSNIQLMNVILTDGYSLFNIEKTGDNIELNNVEFRYAVESMLRIGGTVGTLNANSIKFGKLSKIQGVAAIISDSNNDVITGIVSNDILPLFAQLDGNNNVLKGVVASTNVIAGDGQNNVYDFYGKTKSETYTGDVSETVHGSKSTHIDVMSTWAVDGNSTESVNGTKSEIVTGVSSAQYNEDRTVNGKNLTETMSGKKVINAQDVILNPTNPLTYKTPTELNKWFKSVPMKSDDKYDVLVDGDYHGYKNIYFVNIKTITESNDITSALKTLSGLSKSIFIPSGTYYISETLELSELRLYGEGNGQTLIHFTNNSYIRLTNSTYNRYCVFEDMSFFNDNDSPYGLYLDKSSLESGWGSCVHLKNIRFENFNQYYILLNQSNQSVFESVVSYSGKFYAGATPLDFDSRLVSNNNEFINCWFANNGGALFEINNFQNNRFRNCVFAESSVYFEAYEMGLNNVNNILQNCWFEPINLFLKDVSKSVGAKQLSSPYSVLTLKNNYYSGDYSFKFFDKYCALGCTRQIVAGGGGYSIDDFITNNMDFLYINKYVAVDSTFYPYLYTTLFNAYTKLAINANESIYLSNDHVTIPLASVINGIQEKAIKCGSFICKIIVITPSEKTYELNVLYNKNKNKYIVDNKNSELQTNINGNTIRISSTSESTGDWYGYCKLENFYNTIK